MEHHDVDLYFVRPDDEELGLEPLHLVVWTSDEDQEVRRRVTTALSGSRYSVQACVEQHLIIDNPIMVNIIGYDRHDVETFGAIIAICHAAAQNAVPFHLSM